MGGMFGMVCLVCTLSVVCMYLCGMCEMNGMNYVNDVYVYMWLVECVMWYVCCVCVICMMWPCAVCGLSVWYLSCICVGYLWGVPMWCVVSCGVCGVSLWYLWCVCEYLCRMSVWCISVMSLSVRCMVGTRARPRVAPSSACETHKGKAQDGMAGAVVMGRFGRS